MMSSMAGVQMNHIPYRASGPALIDLSEGRIDVTFGVLGTALSLINDGKVRALAVTTEKRAESVPNVPTMAEAGLPGFEASLWFAIMAPAAVPPAIVTRLNREINAIVLEADIKKALAQQATEADVATPDKLGEIIRNDIEKWRAIAVKAGVKPE
jgi:tripartite-type tricarboxylate transporter receptor subunit TctC